MYTYMNMNIILIHGDQAYKVCSHYITRRGIITNTYTYSISMHGVYELILTKNKTSTIPIFYCSSNN